MLFFKKYFLRFFLFDENHFLFFRIEKQFSKLLILTFLFIKTCTFSYGQITPPNFEDSLVYTSNNNLIGLTFDSNGRLFTWNKFGKIFMLENGVNTIVFDIGSLVYENSSELGLLNLKLDPNFLTNGYIYVSYALKDDLVAGYNASYGSASATYGRVSRFTIANPSTSNPSGILSSELILLGNNNKGIPVTSGGHFGGALEIADDGTILVSAGESASFSLDDNGSDSTTYYQSALEYGIIDNDENIGSLRCQLLTSISGKLLRIDPVTGLGLPDNPYYE